MPSWRANFSADSASEIVANAFVSRPVACLLKRIRFCEMMRPKDRRRSVSTADRAICVPRDHSWASGRFLKWLAALENTH